VSSPRRHGDTEEVGAKSRGALVRGYTLSQRTRRDGRLCRPYGTLFLFLFFPQGLRPGLYSAAASRLGFRGALRGAEAPLFHGGVGFSAQLNVG
jgi:hypothetical protein